MGKIVCIGHAVVDVLLEGLDLKNGIDKSKFDREFLQLSGITISTGGDAVNEAIVLGRMGSEVSLIVGLGRDKGGLMIANVAEQAGVNTEQIVWDENGKTQNNILVIQKDKEKYFFCEPTQNSGRLKPNIKMFEGASIVILASLFYPPFDYPEIVKETIQMAKASGAIVCADVNIGKNSNLKDVEMHEALGGLDYIFPNEEEAFRITGEKELSTQAERLLACGIKNVIIKLGANGNYFRNSIGEKTYPAFKGEMVDATGAGDSFLAGFAYGLSQNRSLDDCFKIAAATGLIAVESVGATDGIKSLQTVKDALKKNNITLEDSI